MAEQFNERTWLIWLGKVRIIVITFLFGIELAVAVLTPTNLPKSLFVLLILLWYAISAFQILLLNLWRESRFQARLQVVADLILASVEYRPDGLLTYNSAGFVGPALPMPYIPAVDQLFAITIDLVNHTSSLSIDGVPRHGSVPTPSPAPRPATTLPGCHGAARRS